ncbi:hypothetical protein ZHAS_00019781 [Anopheles sinensis]|uniref:Uncharacterized protein n=1 Tax=Anopheles sinensis TaxID=74873 RepID=A0A084WNA1_ANOSI|nr:hypothetical protein ZHAS_00019781 [Anopheles sinensis]
MNDNKKHMDEIGGALPEEMELDDIEERILAVTQLNNNATSEPECIYIKAEPTAVELQEETGSSDTDSCDQEEGGPSNTQGSNDEEEGGPSNTEAKIDQDIKQVSQTASARQPHDDDKIEILIRQNDAIIKFLSNPA